MKNTYSKLISLIIITFVFGIQEVFSQGIMISDNSETNADASAVLEVQSNSKGLLIPRLTTSQRNALTSYAKEGLLVYDSDIGSFFIFGKNSLGSLNWNDLSTPSGIWKTNSNDVYLANPYANVGIGTSSPNKKLVIKAQNDNDTLFEIIDKDGKPLMIITPTLTKFYFNETGKGVAGGFAVGRYATAKSNNDTAVFIVTKDSTRIYTSVPLSKGVAGGFAVGRYATAKGENANKFFYTGIDSTRVYTDGSGQKGVAGGFAVGRYATAKSGGTGNYMYMKPDNYFIGDSSGFKLQNSSFTGKFNTFIGYQTGLNDTSGNSNVFIGYQAGYSNIEGSYNVFIGNESGSSNTFGEINTFVGYQAGKDNTTGIKNVFVGYQAGKTNTTGVENISIGSMAGYLNSTGKRNICIGDSAGVNNTTSNNVFIGVRAGENNTIGKDNMFIGNFAGIRNTEGNANTYLGLSAGYNLNGSNNTLLGAYAGYTTSTTTADYNVYIGQAAGMLNGGDNNIFLGNGTSVSTPTGAYNNIYIGNKIRKNGSSQLIIDGEGDEINPLIYGDFSQDLLRFNAHVGVGIAPSTNYKLYVYEPAATSTSASRAGYFNSQGGSTSGNSYGVISKSYSYGTSDSYAIYADADDGSTTGKEWAFYGLGMGYFSNSVGVGTNTPDYPFEVEKSNAGSNVGDNKFISMFKNTGGVNSDGIKVQAGGTDAATTGDVIYMFCADGDGDWVGSIYSTNGTLAMNGKSASYSKGSNIKISNNGLNIINQLEVVDYDFNLKNNTYKTGFVGEDVLKVFPAMVSYEKTANTYGISNSTLVPILTKGIQEQQNQIEELKNEIKELKLKINKITELESIVKELKEQLNNN